MTVLLFFAGFTTIVAFFAVGLKCAQFLSPRFGKIIYLIYAVLAFSFFSNFPPEKVQLIMSISAGLLVLINTLGILKLRNNIGF